MAPALTRASILVSMSLVLVASTAPLAAQRAEMVRRAPREMATDSVEAQLRRLQRAADSLSNLFFDDNLSASERRLRVPLSAVSPLTPNDAACPGPSVNLWRRRPPRASLLP